MSDARNSLTNCVRKRQKQKNRKETKESKQKNRSVTKRVSNNDENVTKQTISRAIVCVQETQTMDLALQAID